MKTLLIRKPFASKPTRSRTTVRADMVVRSNTTNYNTLKQKLHSSQHREQLVRADTFACSKTTSYHIDTSTRIAKPTKSRTTCAHRHVCTPRRPQIVTYERQNCKTHKIANDLCAPTRLYARNPQTINMNTRIGKLRRSRTGARSDNLVHSKATSDN